MNDHLLQNCRVLFEQCFSQNFSRVVIGISLDGLIFPRQTLPVITEADTIPAYGMRKCASFWALASYPVGHQGSFLPLTARDNTHTSTDPVPTDAKMATSFTLPEDLGSVDDYFKARQSFVNAERALSYESKVTSSELEARAQEIVHTLKKWEESNHHGVRIDGSGCEAGHRFLHGLDAIENSKLFNIAQKAPKGSLLHCHFDCILPPRSFLDDARKQDRLHIKTDCPLTTAGFFACALPQFCVLPQAVDLSETTNVFSKTYVAGSWMKYSEFLSLFPGGLERAEAWLSNQMVIPPDDAYHPHQTVDG